MNPRLAAFLLLPLLALAARAQNPSFPAPNPGAYPVGNPAVNPMVPGTPDQEPVRLQFPNTDISAVLQFYEQLTNKHVITDNAVQGTINININKPVSRDEAIRIIETCLYLNGFSFASDESGNILKLVGNGKNPRSYGINIYSDATQIPDNVSIVSVLFQLQYADSKEIKQLIDQYLTGASSPYSSSVPLPGALLITESAGMLRNIAKVIAAADVPPAEVVSRFYALQRASAKDVVDKMNKLFDKQAGAPGGAEPAAAPPPGHPGVTFAGHTGTASLANVLALRASVTGLSEDSIIVGKIKLDFDERTNRIHVVTRPVNLHFIEDLIAQFDSDIQFGEPSKRALKYVSASDVLDVVVKAITEPGTKNDGTDTSASTTSRNNTQPTNGTTNGNSSNGNSSGSGSSGSGINITEGLSTQPVDTTPKAVTVGSTKIIADPRENTIIVLGNDEVKRKIFLLLDQLDVRAPQVMISAVIGEFTLTNDSQVGIDYLLHYPSGGLVSLLGSGSSGGTGVLSALSGNHGFGLSNFSNSGVTNALASGLGAGTGFTAAIGAANSLDVIVSALESTGRFRITNRPYGLHEQQQEGDHRVRRADRHSHQHAFESDLERRRGQLHRSRAIQRRLRAGGAAPGSGAAHQFRPRSLSSIAWCSSTAPQARAPPSAAAACRTSTPATCAITSRYRMAPPWCWAASLRARSAETTRTFRCWDASR